MTSRHDLMLTLAFCIADTLASDILQPLQSHNDTREFCTHWARTLVTT